MNQIIKQTGDDDYIIHRPMTGYSVQQKQETKLNNKNNNNDNNNNKRVWIV